MYFKIDLFYVYERFPARACSAPRGQERVLDPLELDLQWLAAIPAPRPGPRSSAREASVPNLRAISPAHPASFSRL